MRSARLHCDSCGSLAPDVVAPILFGFHGWREFGIDGTDEDGRRWEASVLLCDDPGGIAGGWKPTGKGCASKMAAFIESGGQAGHGPTPPVIRTSNGGRDTEPTYLDEKAATA